MTDEKLKEICHALAEEICEREGVYVMTAESIYEFIKERT